MSANDSVTSHDSGMYADTFVKGGDDFVKDIVHPVSDNVSSATDNGNSFTDKDDSATDIDDSDFYFGDDWPKMPDGSEFDGTKLSDLVLSGSSPFQGIWDVNLLIREVEDNLGAQVIDIPFVSSGSNNYVSFTCCPIFMNTVLMLRPNGA